MSKGKTRLPKLRGKIDIETLRFAYEVLIQHKQENIQQHKIATAHLMAKVEKRKSSQYYKIRKSQIYWQVCVKLARVLTV